MVGAVPASQRIAVLGRLEESDRVAYMKSVVETFLPDLKDQMIASGYMCWNEDPYQGGAWGWIQPGEYRWMWPACRRPAGRVHFAGEHTSIWIAWMNGALESGERLSREILAFDRQQELARAS